MKLHFTMAPEAALPSVQSVYELAGGPLCAGGENSRPSQSTARIPGDRPRASNGVKSQSAPYAQRPTPLKSVTATTTTRITVTSQLKCVAKAAHTPPASRPGTSRKNPGAST